MSLPLIAAFAGPRRRYSRGSSEKLSNITQHVGTKRHTTRIHACLDSHHTLLFIWCDSLGVVASTGSQDYGEHPLSRHL